MVGGWGRPLSLPRFTDVETEASGSVKPRATQLVSQRQEPGPVYSSGSCPQSSWWERGQPELKGEGASRGPRDPWLVNSGREGSPQGQGLCRLWLAGRQLAWGLMAGLGHLPLFLS